MRVEVVFGRKPPEAAGEAADDIYEADDAELAVGDIVLLPGTWRAELTGYSEPKEATVTNLGSRYKGPVRRILGVVERGGAASGAPEPGQLS
jgi:hypothetical protein